MSAYTNTTVLDAAHAHAHKHTRPHAGMYSALASLLTLHKVGLGRKTHPRRPSLVSRPAPMTVAMRMIASCRHGFFMAVWCSFLSLFSSCSLLLIVLSNLCLSRHRSVCRSHYENSPVMDFICACLCAFVRVLSRGFWLCLAGRFCWAFWVLLGFGSSDSGFDSSFFIFWDSYHYHHHY